MASESCNPAQSSDRIYLGLEHLASGFPALTGIGQAGQVRSAKTVFREGDVLYGKLRPYLRKAVLAPFGGMCSTDILVLRPTEDVAPEYLSYLAHSDQFVQRAIATTSGVNHPRTSWSKLGPFVVPVPPFAEQRRIAALLSAVRQAIEQQQRLIALTVEIKKALMHKLFTEGTRGEPQKETEIGLIPESWEVTPLGDLAFIGNGSTPKRDNPGYWAGGSIPWLTSGKIHEGRIERADEFATQLASMECHLPPVPANSLLVAITGQGKTLGNTAQVTFETRVSQHLAYIRWRKPETVSADFFRYYLQRQYEDLRRLSVGAGSTKRALTCGTLKRYAVPIPDLDEQMEIAENLEFQDSKRDQHFAVSRSLQDLFRTLLHQLMTAQIRVDQVDLSELVAVGIEVE